MLEEGRGHLVVHLSLDRPAHDRGLVLASREDQDLPRLEDRRDAHRERFSRHVLLAEEIGCRVLPGHQVESHQPSPALRTGAGLVEADVTGPPDAEKLEIDPAGRPDLLFVATAFIFYSVPRHVAPREVNVVGQDVEMGEQILPHEPVIGMDAPRVHGVVLVQIEGDDIRKAQPFLLVHSNELAIDSYGGRTGGQTEDGAGSRPAPGLNKICDPAGDEQPNLVVIVHDDGAEAFAGCSGLRTG